MRQEFEEWSALDLNIGRGVLRRIDRGMAAFFRRVKAGETPGYPRFKPRSRFRCIELAEVRQGMLRRSADGRRAWVHIKGLPTIMAQRHKRRARKTRQRLERELTDPGWAIGLGVVITLVIIGMMLPRGG